MDCHDQSHPGEANKKITVFRVTRPYLNVLVKPRIFMPPTLEKVKRHIALGLSVFPSICPSV